MTAELEQRIAAGDLAFLDEQALVDFVVRQRWFGSKSQEVVGASVLDAAVLRSQEPLLVLALVEIRFHAGTHEIYQLPAGFRAADDGWEDGVISSTDGLVVYDALADRALARELVQLVRAGATVEEPDVTLEFRPAGDLLAVPAEYADVRPVGGEQSNSSLVFDESLVLKVYRRIEAGINPELELLRFLTERGFPNVAALAGWYGWSGRRLDSTLGILQQFVPGARDGWELALDELASDPDGFLGRVRRLGEVTGAMHATLGSDPSDSSFCPEEPSAEALGLLTASIDEEIEQVFLDLPPDETLAPIAGRGEEVREQLRQLTHIGATGRVIRHHGDYHLGQVLWTGEDWVVLDFEGEPARPLPERRRKRSPLRDVAGMLRSFAYAASASALTRGVEPPAGWEARAREEFLAGYLPEVEPTGLLPPGQDATRRLLSVFELEKAVYELRYELDNRPEWIGIPVAGIVRLLEGEGPS